MLVLFPGRSMALHLVGGSITYKYMGMVNGQVEYQVTLDMFRDCSNSLGAPFDATVKVAVYERTKSSSGDTDLLQVLSMNLGSVTSVQPPSAGQQCNVKPQTCLEEGLYIDYLFVAPSPYGYYLETQRCCRNSMLNVPDNVGQSYFAIIPPTSIINSTPVFSAVPTPYFCANDTVTLNYSAAEPDGDSLVYSLGWPWAGGNSTTQIIPPPSPTFTGLPYVPYNSGYSPAYPLSKNGYASIDMFTGILTLLAPGVGRYAIAVDISEYRQGKLISVTRRDVQLITVGNCPKHPAPSRVAIVDSLPQDNTTGTSFTVKAGHRLSFNIRYKATNANLTAFSASGFFTNPIGLTYKPYFTFSIDNTNTYVTAYFNWQTTCKEGRTIPYTFTIAAADDGCPPKTTYQGFTIYVNKGVDHINGPKKICNDSPYYRYTTNPPLKGDTVFWSVNGGTFKVLNDSEIEVAWNKGIPQGTVRASSLNDAGCVSDTVVYKVTLLPKLPGPVIAGPQVVCPFISEPYSVSSYSSLRYRWSITGGTIKDTDANEVHIHAVLSPNPYHILKAAGIDSNGCLTDTASLLLNTVASSTDTIKGETPVCPNTSGLVYSVPLHASTIYYWKIHGGTQTGGGNGNIITVHWGSKGTGMVEVYEDRPGACYGDTLEMPVIKDHVLKISPIQGDSSMCEYTGNKNYSVKDNPFYQFDWAVLGGTLTSGNGTPSINVDWGKAGKGLVTVKQVSYDSVTLQPCASVPDSFWVTLKPLPNPSEISGPVKICTNGVYRYSVTGMAGSTYLWTVNGKKRPETTDSIDILVQNIQSKYDTLHITVEELAADKCPGPTRYLDAVMYKAPALPGIIGPVTVCQPGLKNIVYKVNGENGASYKWHITGGDIISPDSVNAVIVNWTKPGVDTIKVSEKSPIGCAGDSVSLPVKVDSLSVEMELVTTEEKDDKLIDIFWSAANDTFFKGYYRIYRSMEGQSYYRLIDSVPYTQTWYTDKRVYTSAYAYRYKVEAVNICGNKIDTKIHRSIRLSAFFDGDTTIKLNWNPYEGWRVRQYQVGLMYNDDTTLTWYSNTGDTQYIVIKTLEGYRECYRIAATKSGSSTVISWSNKTCVDFDPMVWIPNVFTPNTDEHNPTFHVFANNYKTYRIDIYNRWGEHIFTSNDPKNQWDGTFKGGACPEGVYLYIVNVGGVRKNIYRSGTVTLLR